MCKIMVMSGLNPKNKELNWQFIQEMGDLMSKRNSDGLGYTALSSDGKLFGERWLNNNDAFDVRKTVDLDSYIKSNDKMEALKQKVIDNFGDTLKLISSSTVDLPKEEYNSFGIISEDITSITLHTRFATSSKGFMNTHPFYDEDTGTSLIHNGVINNVEVMDNIRSTCDSERILNKYLEYNVASNPNNIQKVADDLVGYYRAAVYAKDTEGKYFIDLFKCDSITGLDTAYVAELGTTVFTTDVEDIKTVCNAMNLTVVATFKYKEETLTRIDAVTGQCILSKSFNAYKGKFTRDFRGVPVSEYKNRLNNTSLMSEADIHEMYNGWEKDDYRWTKNKKNKA